MNEQGVSVEQPAGVLLILLILLDVFLTVLYARANTGIISPRLAYGVWGIFKLISKPKYFRSAPRLGYSIEEIDPATQGHPYNCYVRLCLKS